MRILTFTSLFPNSQAPNFGIFVQQRISHFAARGNQVQIIAPVPFVPKFLRGDPAGHMATLPLVETIGGLTVHHPRYALVPKISMPLHGFLMYLGCRGVVRGLHDECPFDCIDAHYVFPDGLAAVLIGRWLGIPVTLTARGSDIHTFPSFATIRPQIRWALRRAAGVTAVSEALMERMIALETSMDVGKVIGNGVDCERFFPENRLAARRKLGLNETEKIILSVAALKHVKGPDLLIRAAALLQKSTPDCRTIFAGKGPELATLQRLASRLDCAASITFVGEVDNQQLRHYYSAADVSCLPSRNEGWPNVVLESLACGTPAVATRVGSVPEILNSPEFGIIVDPTAEHIHSGLRTTLARSWNSEHLVAYARTRTWDNVATSMEEFLHRSIRKSVMAAKPATSECRGSAATQHSDVVPNRVIEGDRPVPLNRD
jgi:glycosyltransferase involved in cell wall biosynthesis